MNDAFVTSIQECITLSVAGKEDTQAINSLLAPRIFSVEDDWNKKQFTLKATRRDGELVATCCLGMVNTKAELNERMENDVFWDGTTFPVATISKVCTLPGTFYDRPLKFVSLFLVDTMKDIPALASETAVPGVGSFVIGKERFQSLLELSYPNISCDWEWQGVLPFENLLPDLRALGSLSKFMRNSMK